MGYITAHGDEVRLQTHEVATEFRRIVQEEGADPGDPEVLAKARSLTTEPPADVGTVMSFVLMWLSEVGRKNELDGLLGYLDSRDNLAWENGGLFYKRSDASIDEGGNVAKVTPLTGNACVAYSRLNVPNGQKIMWEKPWTSQLLASRPWIDDVDLSQGVDCLRGTWDADAKALILTAKAWEDNRRTILPTAKNLEAGIWAAYIDGNLEKHSSVDPGGVMTVEVEVGVDEVDVVFQKID